MNLAGHTGHTGIPNTGGSVHAVQCSSESTGDPFRILCQTAGLQYVPQPSLSSRQCAVSLLMNDSDNSHYRTHQHSHTSSMGGSTEGLSPPSPHTVKAAATTHPPIGGVGGHQGTMAPGGHGSPACVGLQDPGPPGCSAGPPAPPSSSPPVSAQIVMKCQWGKVRSLSKAILTHMKHIYSHIIRYCKKISSCHVLLFARYFLHFELKKNIYSRTC